MEFGVLVVIIIVSAHASNNRSVFIMLHMLHMLPSWYFIKFSIQFLIHSYKFSLY